MEKWCGRCMERKMISTCTEHCMGAAFASLCPVLSSRLQFFVCKCVQRWWKTRYILIEFTTSLTLRVNKIPLYSAHYSLSQFKKWNGNFSPTKSFYIMHHEKIILEFEMLPHLFIYLLITGDAEGAAKTFVLVVRGTLVLHQGSLLCREIDLH